MTLSEATKVEPTSAGQYSGEIQPGWDVMGNTNGGYLMAMAARAAGHAAGRPDPVTVTAHFMRPGRPGPVIIDTDVVRSGRRFAVVRATVSAQKPLITALGTYGTLENPNTITRLDQGPPALPPPEECVAVAPTTTFPPPFVGRVELRLDPRPSIFTTGVPTGRLQVQGWLRLPEGETIDTMALLVAVDAFPPASFNSDLPTAWTPTVELTAHVRCRPEPGWLRCSFKTRFISGGFLEEDGEIWDEAGQLVAQSRQLALIPRP